jgi:hypothetical protein
VLADTVTTADLPPPVRAFISAHIDSLDQLEILLLLHGSPRRWSADEVVAELRLSPASVDRRLALLRKRRLIVQEDANIALYRFPSDDARLRASVDLLAATYRQRRVAVTLFVVSNPLDNVTTFDARRP